MAGKDNLDLLPPAKNGHVVLVNGGPSFDGNTNFHDGSYTILILCICKQLQNTNHHLHEAFSHTSSTIFLSFANNGKYIFKIEKKLCVSVRQHAYK